MERHRRHHLHAAKASLASGHATALACFTGAQYAAASGNVLFDGQAFSVNDILVKYTFLGDANADGRVDLNDLNLVLNNLGTPTLAWTSGNFDGQPTIDLNDLNAVLNNLSVSVANNATAQYAESLVAAATPEPASLAIIGCVAPFLLSRLRRSCTVR